MLILSCVAARLFLKALCSSCWTAVPQAQIKLKQKICIPHLSSFMPLGLSRCSHRLLSVYSLGNKFESIANEIFQYALCNLHAVSVLKLYVIIGKIGFWILVLVYQTRKSEMNISKSGS